MISQKQSMVSEADSARAGWRREDWTQVIERFIPGIVFVTLWWIAIRFNPSLSFYLSTPGDVATFLGESVSDSEFWRNVSSTMQATFISFFIGSVLGIAAGISVSLSPRVEAAIEPYASALNSLPRIALAPVFIAFLGLGTAGKVAVGVSLVFFVLYYNCRAGVKSVDPDWSMLARTLNFSKRKTFFSLLLPVTWPSIFSGLRLAFTYALLGVVSSEIVAARAGMGQLIMLYSAQFRMDAVYGTLIWMGVISGGVYWIAGRVEKRIMSWK
ncbi:ABC transporter permease [Mesorhizobium sp. RP14(2022)]|uniref:ABC transporter permease n=1 Tax=Mesorhizobium liriopis TaxID=2953882 RepID=A0ABT1C484_9HYPH|nr:ABC transporter permease [Mesorhizobium liriopis]MCO6049328.1 ABC transporter permease [Mesorhizobium liriopis]